MNAESAYLFRHALLRDAAYQLHLPGERARLHRLCLEAIEAVCGGAPPEPPPIDAPDAGLFAEHASDAFAEELADHARLAEAPGSDAGPLRAARRLYLRRAAELANRAFRLEPAARAWTELAGLLDESEEAMALGKAGQLAHFAAQPQAALQLWQRSLEIHRRLGQRRSAAISASNLAILAGEFGRIAEAEQRYREALALHRDAGDLRSEVLTTVNLASLYHDTGRLDLAERAFEAALSHRGKPGLRDLEGTALGSLAGLFKETGRIELAERVYAEALALHRESGDRRSEGIVLGNMANMLGDTGRTGAAEKLYEEALAIHRQTGNRRSEGIMRANLAGLHAATGRAAEAERGFERALAIDREVGNRWAEGVALGGFAGLLCSRGRLAEGLPAFSEALAIHRELGNRRFEGAHSCDYALALLESGDPAAAATWRTGAALLREIGDTAEAELKCSDMRSACARRGVPLFDGI